MAFNVVFFFMIISLCLFWRIRLLFLSKFYWIGLASSSAVFSWFCLHTLASLIPSHSSASLVHLLQFIRYALFIRHGMSLFFGLCVRFFSQIFFNSLYAWVFFPSTERLRQIKKRCVISYERFVSSVLCHATDVSVHF